MTRDHLEELAKWHESCAEWWMSAEDAREGVNRTTSHAKAAEFHAKSAVFIRSLLAQEPVAWRVYSYPTEEWLYTHGNVPAYRGEPLYAAPVPAVDLEAFKAEAMRLADVVARCYASRDIPTGVLYRNIAEKNWKDARASLAAHLDKLGGKND